MAFRAQGTAARRIIQIANPPTVFPLAGSAQEASRMKSGDGAQDATRQGSDDAAGPVTAGPAITGGDGDGEGDGDGKQARSPGTQEPLQAIQDLIDKLAAVTQQLRSWRRGSGGMPDPTR
jgi:hypothetical protein